MAQSWRESKLTLVILTIGGALLIALFVVGALLFGQREPCPDAAVQAETCPSIEERLYLVKVNNILTAASGTGKGFGLLSLEATNNPELLQDRSWMMDMTLVLTRFHAIADHLSDIDAPESAYPVHNELLELASSMRAFVSLYGLGLEEAEPSMLGSANAEMQDLTTSADAMKEIVNSFCD